MEFIADLHIHSRFSRATAKNLNLETLYIEAQQKGITVVATGDFTHPEWWAELQEKLVPTESGLFKLDPTIAKICDDQVPSTCRGPVRFMLETEISNIYKKGARTRKNHNLVYMPDMDSALRFNQQLERIGNIHSDGRPILGLDARDLLEIVLETASDAHLIPAHVWTPWFSVLGSKSGFDSISECFGDLSDHIFALETGLSSDPPMNWRISALDDYSLVSNSDAHSPSKLGREANRFSTELSYQAIFAALKQNGGDHFKGTVEFYPEEGKYHVDGHRKCGVQLQPRETRIYEGLCPVCGKPLVLGVLHRVEALADRPLGYRPAGGRDYVHLVPLEDILAQLLRVGPKSKKVVTAQAGLLAELGTELDILHTVPLADFEVSAIPHLAEAIRRVRSREISFSPGYDGEYGRLQIFSPDEWAELGGQRRLFDVPNEVTPTMTPPAVVAASQSGIAEDRLSPIKEILEAASTDRKPGTAGWADADPAIDLNPEQAAVVAHPRLGGPLIVVAGPGTGKTRVLIERIVHLVNNKAVHADGILAVTFTQKAAAEMQTRLGKRLADDSRQPVVATFHSLCLQLMRENDADGDGAEVRQPSINAGGIVSGARQRALLADALDIVKRTATEQTPVNLTVKAALAGISAAKQRVLPPEAPEADLIAAAGGLDITAVYPVYQRLLQHQAAWDFDDLIFNIVTRLETDDAYCQTCRQRFSHIFVDEYQDLNAGQYRIVKALCPPESQLCVIGDPDQAIYGFRGAKVSYFNDFLEDYPGARVVHLRRNYRSVQTVLTAAFGIVRDQHVSLTGDSDDQPMAQVPGCPLICELTAATERSEAVAIGKTIAQMIGGTGFHHLDFGAVKDTATARQRSFGDFAVLYRTHGQGELLAHQLGKGGIPCQVASRRHLLDNPAVSALIATVQVVNNTAAFSDFETMAAVFKAGIGPRTFAQIKNWAYRNGLGLRAALSAARRVPLPGITMARQQNLYDFILRIDLLRGQTESLSVADQIRHLLEHTPIGTVAAEDLKLGGDLTRPLSRLMETAAKARMDRGRFLEALGLLNDTDLYDPRAERVALLTLHAAKGLEFPVVFITGCEDGFLPYRRRPEVDANDPDEERRLLYVGMTRARYQLFLCRAEKRRIHGKAEARERSPFLTAIDDDLLTEWDRNAPQQAAPRQRQLGLFD